MKKIILILTVLIANSVLADTVSPISNIAKRYEQVTPSKIVQLQDSLEKDSLLEFSINQITYSDVDFSLLDKILTDISNNVFPTQKNGVSHYGQTHYSYDEENKKIYSGTTYISIEKNDNFTVITILWAKPAINPETIGSND
jgi:hypothetical protein